MTRKMFYKYRSLASLDFVLDILVNGRMFASSFESLNDPMEGAYLYNEGPLDRDFARSLYRQKVDWRILSLGETPYDSLM
jgi:hypothetical protein